MENERLGREPEIADKPAEPYPVLDRTGIDDGGTSMIFVCSLRKVSGFMVTISIFSYLC